MGELQSPESQGREEEPLSREEIILAQAEIKDLLSRSFSDTFLKELFIEPVPVHPVDGTRARGIQRDYIGTRVISGVGIHSSQERVLQVKEKPRKIRKGQTQIGEVIRLIEPGSGSSVEPVIEHSIIEIRDFNEVERRLNPPNTKPAVDNALDLARQVSKGR